MTSTDKLRFYCSPMVQFQLLHSKFHLCSVATRGLLLSTYIKFVNLFPEIKNHIQDVSCIQCILSFKFIYCRYLNIIMGWYFKVNLGNINILFHDKFLSQFVCLVLSFLYFLQVLKSQNQLRNADVELQQRAVEYLQLSTVASTDVLVSLCIPFGYV